MMMLRFALLLSLALPLWCQPKAVEVFGQAGYGSASGGDGSLGSGAVYGGAVTLPFSPRWAVDVDVQYTRTTYNARTGNTFGTRRTLISPAVQYRRGSDRIYWFAGAGLGGAIDNTYDLLPGRAEITHNNSAAIVPVRTGVVAGITKHLLVRVDLYLSVIHVGADGGAKIGIGYRF